MIVNESKTEVCVYSNVKPIIKKLRTLLDETTKIDKWKKLVDFAFYKSKKSGKTDSLAQDLKMPSTMCMWGAF